MHRSGIVGLYGDSIFSVLRNFHTVSHTGYANLHPHQQCRRAPFSPHPLQHVLFIENLRGESDDSQGRGMGNSRKQSGVGGVLWVGAEGHSPTPGAEWGGKRNEAPPLSAEGKGTWLSLLLPHPVHGRGRVLVPHSFQGLRSCSLLSLWKKLLPNS